MPATALTAAPTGRALPLRQCRLDERPHVGYRWGPDRLEHHAGVVQRLQRPHVLLTVRSERPVRPRDGLYDGQRLGEPPPEMRDPVGAARVVDALAWLRGARGVSGTDDGEELEIGSLAALNLRAEGDSVGDVELDTAGWHRER